MFCGHGFPRDFRLLCSLDDVPRMIEYAWQVLTLNDKFLSFPDTEGDQWKRGDTLVFAAMARHPAMYIDFRSR